MNDPQQSLSLVFIIVTDRHKSPYPTEEIFFPQQISQVSQEWDFP